MLECNCCGSYKIRTEPSMYRLIGVYISCGDCGCSQRVIAPGYIPREQYKRFLILKGLELKLV